MRIVVCEDQILDYKLNVAPLSLWFILMLNKVYHPSVTQKLLSDNIRTQGLLAWGKA